MTESDWLHERGLETVFGEVRVERAGYGAAGVESLHPMDAELNLPQERYSHEVRRRVARAAKDFDTFYKERYPYRPAEQTGSILVMTDDGKGIVMRREDLREKTKKKAATTQHKLLNRVSRGEKRNAKRIATVTGVYTVAPYERTAEDVLRCLAPQNEREKPKGNSRSSRS